MTSLMFVCPVHGRLPLARICLRQLQRTCDELTKHGIYASAIVVSDRETLDTLDLDGFGYVCRDNEFLSRRFNDGIQLATDPDRNPLPADYVAPIGSDDWIDWRLLLDLPKPDEMIGFQRISFVREDGREITARYLGYDGGCGIRVYPRQVLEPLGYRPADEDRKRACDTSILINVRRANPHMRVMHAPSDARQIVDWKSSDQQLNTYADLNMHRGQILGDPFDELAEFFPAEALDEMQTHYGLVAVA